MNNPVVPTMENTDFSKKIEMSLLKEMQDVKNYVDMMKQEDRNGNREWASGFYYMAKDEYTHAIFLHEILEDLDFKMMDATQKEFEEFTKEFEDMFQ